MGEAFRRGEAQREEGLRMGPSEWWGLREEELKGLMGSKGEGCFQRERGASQKKEGVLERGWGR